MSTSAIGAIMITNCAKMRSFNCFTLIIGTVPPGRRTNACHPHQKNPQFLRGAQRAVNHARRLSPPGAVLARTESSGQSRRNSVFGPLAREQLQTLVRLDESACSRALACVPISCQCRMLLRVGSSEKPSVRDLPNCQACASDTLWKA